MTTLDEIIEASFDESRGAARGKCECADPGCPAHKGKSTCTGAGHQILRRVDMDDRTGTRMCKACAADAYESGLFEASLDEGDYYVSTYCNFAHRMKDGKPIAHECRIIPPQALHKEREGDIEGAIEIMRSSPTRMMRHGVKKPKDWD